nr:dihydrodipicolinate reductase C-terminal domain-containing protein [Agrobacterium vitis]
MIFGQNGRVAKILAQSIEANSTLELIACVPARGQSVEQIVKSIECTPPNTVILDFTHRASLSRLIEASHQVPRKLITGTSDLTDEEETGLRLLAARRTIMLGRNFSPGAVIARQLIEFFQEIAPSTSSWDAAIIDFHHKLKVDVPSATARDWGLAWNSTDSSTTVPISSIRVGNGISEHVLVAASVGERIEITHRLMSFEATITGVLAAVHFVSQKATGFYSPIDIVKPDG